MKKLFVISFAAAVVLLVAATASAQSGTDKQKVTPPVNQTNTDAPKAAGKMSPGSGVDKKYIVIAPNGDELIMIAPPEETKTAVAPTEPEIIKASDKKKVSHKTEDQQPK